MVAVLPTPRLCEEKDAARHAIPYTVHAAAAELADAVDTLCVSFEKMHESNYRKAYEKLKSGQCFTSSDPNAQWICINCGYVATGCEPPKICPTCSHPQGYFKIKQS